MKKTIPVYDLYIDDSNDIDGLTGMGFVEQPAIGVNFVLFNKSDKLNNSFIMSDINVEQRIVCGPSMIPDKKIIRQNSAGELYYAKFTVDEVKKAAHKFLKDSKQHVTTEQHKLPAPDLYMIESWITENEFDKIYTKYNYSPEEVKLGSWCIMYKIENDDILNKIKSGEINGFSIEAYLSDKLTTLSSYDELMNRIDKYKNKEELIDILKNNQ